MLYSIGAVQFEVAPLSANDVSHEVGHDFAAKDLVGAKRAREKAGEADEPLNLCGKIFPHHFGGLPQFEALKEMARAGDPQIVIRGDGSVLGWFVIEKVKGKETFLDKQGVGRMIEFDVSMQAAGRASPLSMLRLLTSLLT